LHHKKKLDVIDHKKKPKKKQPKKHKYRELLTHLQCCTKAPLSYKEQAQIVECSERLAKMVTKENFEAGIITKTPTIYNSRGRTLSGKNIYGRGKNFDPKLHLIDGVELLISTSKQRLNINHQTLEKHKSPIYNKIESKNTQKQHTIIRRFVERKVSKDGSYKNFTPKKNLLRNLDKSKFAKDKHRSLSGKFLGKDEKIVLLKAYGFEEHASKAPSWWFRDLARLKAALGRLRSKIKRGFRVKNFFKFISYLLKRGTFGYRRHVARNTSLAINRPTIERIDPYMDSDAKMQGYEALKELHKKHKLDLSFSNVQKLLRQGFDKLSMSAEVMLKRLKFPGIVNVNAFMHHLLSMREPYDILRKRNE